jgi:hypothetical protein
MTTSEYYTLEEIDKMNVRILIFGNENLKPIVGKLLTIIPKSIADCIIDNCIVTSTWNYGPGMTIPSQLIKGKNVIVISEFTLNSDDNYRDTIILTEFAHCWLKHESKKLINLNKKSEDKSLEQILIQVEKETEQELDAQELVTQWLEHIV